MKGVMNFNRTREVVEVLFENELHHFIHSIGIYKYLPFHRRLEPKESNFATQPETVRRIFEELGGAFVKLGQLLALRPDLIGKEYSKEFEKLLMDIDPLPKEVIKNIVKGRGFKNFDYIPLGCGSVAQVHKAQVKQGKKLIDVAVKIKKPGIDKIFSEDIKIMEYLAKQSVEKYHPTYLNPVEVVEEFKRYTEKELSLDHEASNMKIFGKNFAKNKDIQIPKVIDEYSDDEVLVMEFVHGKNILHVRKNSPESQKVIRSVTNSVYKMLFEDRFFHADLHPGNVFVNRGKVIFLDYGIVGHIDSILERKLFSLFTGLVNGDIGKIANALVDLNIGDDDVDVGRLREGLYNVLEGYYDVSIEKMNFAKIFYGAIEVARRSRLKMPANLILFGKSLVTMEGFCREVSPDFNVIANAKPYVHKMMMKKVTPKNIAKKIKNTTYLLQEIVSKLPETLVEASRKFNMIEKRIVDIDNTFRILSDRFWKAAKLLTNSILFTAFFVAGILMRGINPINDYIGFSYLSIICFVFCIPLLISVIFLLKE